MPRVPSSDVDVVIFGGAGFIGGHLAARHLARGDRVLVADLVPSRIQGVGMQLVDVRQPIRLAVQSPPRLVYNLAAIHRTPGHSPHEYYETNIAGALNVTGWVSSIGASRLLFTSSIAVYGPTEAAVDEATEPSPTTDYGRSKLLAEEVHARWAAEGRGRVLVTIRPAVIFGPGEGGNFSRMGQAITRGRFVIPGRPDTIKSCGYVEDLVDAALSRLECAAPGRELYNFSFPKLYSITDIAAAMADVVGRRRPPVLPRSPVNAALKTSRLVRGSRWGQLNARIQKLLMSTTVVPRALQDAGFNWRHDLDSSLTEWHTRAGAFV